MLGEDGNLDAGASRAGERLMLRRSPLALDLPITLRQNPDVTESALKLVPRFKCRPCSARGLAGLGSFPTAPLHCRDRQRWRSAIVSFRRSKTDETGWNRPRPASCQRGPRRSAPRAADTVSTVIPPVGRRARKGSPEPPVN